jgi:2-succinyl-5-enolpyruvyl-6-hydroxy-3-cyclohexene-1-carboxylate synthase
MVRLPETVIAVGSVLLVRKGCANFVAASSEANRHAVQTRKNLRDPSVGYF